MSLDELARQATLDVVDRVTPATRVRLADLKVTRSRRSRVGAAALIAVLVAGVAAGARFLASDPKPSLLPAGGVRNGVLVVLKGEAPLVQRPTNGLGSLPTDVAPHSPLAFTSEGRELVYRNQNEQYVAFDLRTRAWRVLHSCVAEPECQVAASPDGRRVAVATGNGIQVTDLATGRSLPVVTGRAYNPQWSPMGDQLLYSDDDDDLSRVRIEAGARPIKVVTLADGHFAVDPRWSPDARTVAFFDYQTRDLRQPLGTYTAMIAPTNGATGPLSLVVAAQGCCGGQLPPALVWAPDGSRLLVGDLNDQELITAFTPDGHRTTPPAGISDLVGQVAWQPVNRP